MVGVPDVPDTLRQAIRRLHAALGPAVAELRPEVLEQACVGYLTLHPTGRIERAGLLAVADMDLPNTTERLWVIDLKNAQVLHRSLVAHGEGSGHLRATRFSKEEKSACTSLGFYRTAGTYDGIHGYSRRIEGLDKGQNANAFDRYVVLHAADYASPKYIQKYGHLGYSRGCPGAAAGAVQRHHCNHAGGQPDAVEWPRHQVALAGWAGRRGGALCSAAGARRGAEHSGLELFGLDWGLRSCPLRQNARIRF